MKRLVYVLILVLLGGGAWSAFGSFRIKHPVSGKEVTVPGQNGPNALLVSGWKTTPAGRQLASGDMILSGQVSPDGKLFAFTNTGYTHHALHIVDLATEKEIATVPMEQAWSGLAFCSRRQPDLRVERRRLSRSATSSISIAGTRTAGRKRAPATRSTARVKERPRCPG